MELKTPLNAKRTSIPEIGRVVSLKGFRKYNLPYVFMWIIYYAWIVSFTTWWTASPLTEIFFSTELRSLLHIFILLSSGIFIFIIQKEWFVKTARMGAVLTIVGIGLFLIAPNPRMKVFSAIMVGTALGIINTSILIPFVFTLNNTEKLYAVLGSNVLISLVSLFQETSSGNYLLDKGDMILSSIMLILALSGILFFKKDSLSVNSHDIGIDVPIFHSRIYLTLFFNCVLAIFCKGVGKGILNIVAYSSIYPVLIWHYLGNIVGCIVYLAIYAHLKRPFIWLGNITFSFFAMGIFCNSFSIQMPFLDLAFAFLLGIANAVGMINVYYILGVVGKKYNSMSYLRLSIFFIGICGGISGVAAGNFIHHKNTPEIFTFVSIVSVAMMLLFIALSPLVSQSQYYDDWARDSEKNEIDNGQLYLFKRYNLSKRETEVCKLLLQGYTMRQISGILSIAYPTVNTYCTSSYRKLEINSKTELLILFKDYIVK